MDIEKRKWEILCSKEDIQQRVFELGQQISSEYSGKKVYIISLLKGSFIFASDLVRNIDLKVRMGFITTSSYGKGLETSGNVEVISDISDDIKGCDVIIVDDIADSGLTMKYVIDHIEAKNPSSIKTCVLLDKPSRRQVKLEPDYIGFTIEDKFVVGYGLNYGDYYRNIPYVFAVTDEEIE